jgi:hypothetical protein
VEFGAQLGLRFNLVVNEADDPSQGRTGFLQLVPGVGQSTKSSADFVRVLLH